MLVYTRKVKLEYGQDPNREVEIAVYEKAKKIHPSGIAQPASKDPEKGESGKEEEGNLTLPGRKECSFQKNYNLPVK